MQYRWHMEMLLDVIGGSLAEKAISEVVQGGSTVDKGEGCVARRVEL